MRAMFPLTILLAGLLVTTAPSAQDKQTSKGAAAGAASSSTFPRYDRVLAQLSTSTTARVATTPPSTLATTRAPSTASPLRTLIETAFQTSPWRDQMHLIRFTLRVSGRRRPSERVRGHFARVPGL